MKRASIGTAKALAGAALVTAITTTQTNCPPKYTPPPHLKVDEKKYDLPLHIRVDEKDILAKPYKGQLEDLANQLSRKVDGRDGLLDDMVRQIIGDQNPAIEINNYIGDVIPSFVSNYKPTLTTAKVTYKSADDYKTAVKMLRGEVIGKSGRYIHLADNFRGKDNKGIARVTGKEDDTLLQLIKYKGENMSNANGVDFLGVAYSPKDNSLILYCSDTSVNSLEKAHLKQFNAFRAYLGSKKPLDVVEPTPLGVNKQVQYKK